MNELLPSEVARLILGYLKEESCFNTYNVFLDECLYLKEYVTLLRKGREYPTNVYGLSLINIIDQFVALKNGGFSAVVPSSTVPSCVVPSSTVPSCVVPSSAVPNSAVPSSAVPIAAVPSSAVSSSAVPSSAVSSHTDTSSSVPKKRKRKRKQKTPAMEILGFEEVFNAVCSDQPADISKSASQNTALEGTVESIEQPSTCKLSKSQPEDDVLATASVDSFSFSIDLTQPADADNLLRTPKRKKHTPRKRTEVKRKLKCDSNESIHPEKVSSVVERMLADKKLQERLAETINKVVVKDPPPGGAATISTATRMPTTTTTLDDFLTSQEMTSDDITNVIQEAKLDPAFDELFNLFEIGAEIVSDPQPPSSPAAPPGDGEIIPISITSSPGGTSVYVEAVQTNGHQVAAPDGNSIISEAYDMNEHQMAAPTADGVLPKTVDTNNHQMAAPAGVGVMQETVDVNYQQVAAPAGNSVILESGETNEHQVAAPAGESVGLKSFDTIDQQAAAPAGNSYILASTQEADYLKVAAPVGEVTCNDTESVQVAAPDDSIDLQPNSEARNEEQKRHEVEKSVTAPTVIETTAFTCGLLDTQDAFTTMAAGDIVTTATTAAATAAETGFNFEKFASDQCSNLNSPLVVGNNNVADARLNISFAGLVPTIQNHKASLLPPTGSSVQQAIAPPSGGIVASAQNQQFVAPPCGGTVASAENQQFVALPSGGMVGSQNQFVAPPIGGMVASAQNQQFAAPPSGGIVSPAPNQFVVPPGGGIMSPAAVPSPAAYQDVMNTSIVAPSPGVAPSPLSRLAPSPGCAPQSPFIPIRQTYSACSPTTAPPTPPTGVNHEIVTQTQAEALLRVMSPQMLSSVEAAHREHLIGCSPDTNPNTHFPLTTTADDVSFDTEFIEEHLNGPLPGGAAAMSYTAQQDWVASGYQQSAAVSYTDNTRAQTTSAVTSYTSNVIDTRPVNVSVATAAVPIQNAIASLPAPPTIIILQQAPPVTMTTMPVVPQQTPQVTANKSQFILPAPSSERIVESKPSALDYKVGSGSLRKNSRSSRPPPPPPPPPPRRVALTRVTSNSPSNSKFVDSVTLPEPPPPPVKKTTSTKHKTTTTTTVSLLEKTHNDVAAVMNIKTPEKLIPNLINCDWSPNLKALLDLASPQRYQSVEQSNVLNKPETHRNNKNNNNTGVAMCAKSLDFNADAGGGNAVKTKPRPKRRGLRKIRPKPRCDNTSDDLVNQVVMEVSRDDNSNILGDILSALDIVPGDDPAVTSAAAAAGELLLSPKRPDVLARILASPRLKRSASAPVGTAPIGSAPVELSFARVSSAPNPSALNGTAPIPSDLNGTAPNPSAPTQTAPIASNDLYTKNLDLLSEIASLLDSPQKKVVSTIAKPTATAAHINPQIRAVITDDNNGGDGGKSASKPKSFPFKSKGKCMKVLNAAIREATQQSMTSSADVDDQVCRNTRSRGSAIPGDCVKKHFISVVRKSPHKAPSSDKRDKLPVARDRAPSSDKIDRQAVDRALSSDKTDKLLVAGDRAPSSDKVDRLAVDRAPSSDNTDKLQVAGDGDPSGDEIGKLPVDRAPSCNKTDHLPVDGAPSSDDSEDDLLPLSRLINLNKTRESRDSQKVVARSVPSSNRSKKPPTEKIRCKTSRRKTSRSKTSRSGTSRSETSRPDASQSERSEVDEFMNSINALRLSQTPPSGGNVKRSSTKDIDSVAPSPPSGRNAKLKVKNADCIHPEPPVRKSVKFTVKNPDFVNPEPPSGKNVKLKVTNTDLTVTDTIIVHPEPPSGDNVNCSAEDTNVVHLEHAPNDQILSEPPGGESLKVVKVQSKTPPGGSSVKRTGVKPPGDSKRNCRTGSKSKLEKIIEGIKNTKSKTFQARAGDQVSADFAQVQANKQVPVSTDCALVQANKQVPVSTDCKQVRSSAKNKTSPKPMTVQIRKPTWFNDKNCSSVDKTKAKRYSGDTTTAAEDGINDSLPNHESEERISVVQDEKNVVEQNSKAPEKSAICDSGDGDCCLDDRILPDLTDTESEPEFVVNSSPKKVRTNVPWLSKARRLLTQAPEIIRPFEQLDEQLDGATGSSAARSEIVAEVATILIDGAAGIDGGKTPDEMNLSRNKRKKKKKSSSSKHGKSGKKRRSSSSKKNGGSPKKPSIEREKNRKKKKEKKKREKVVIECLISESGSDFDESVIMKSPVKTSAQTPAALPPSAQTPADSPAAPAPAASPSAPTASASPAAPAPAAPPSAPALAASPAAAPVPAAVVAPLRDGEGKTGLSSGDRLEARAMSVESVDEIPPALDNNCDMFTPPKTVDLGLSDSPETNDPLETADMFVLESESYRLAISDSSIETLKASSPEFVAESESDIDVRSPRNTPSKTGTRNRKRVVIETNHRKNSNTENLSNYLKTIPTNRAPVTGKKCSRSPPGGVDAQTSSLEEFASILVKLKRNVAMSAGNTNVTRGRNRTMSREKMSPVPEEMSASRTSTREMSARKNDDIESEIVELHKTFRNSDVADSDDDDSELTPEQPTKRICKTPDEKKIYNVEISQSRKTQDSRRTDSVAPPVSSVRTPKKLWTERFSGEQSLESDTSQSNTEQPVSDMADSAPRRSPRKQARKRPLAAATKADGDGSRHKKLRRKNKPALEFV